ncbi:hypothetical protein EF912_20550 [Streptomyces sp. WAC07061]|uniref:hypothetical protein n=1 Tax=Streptomyces sp. WAC07061 TaxID=2487410 RepID=UPI000F7782B3|nr:hypothetical protein [Streptomyces sp. WAC07061]RSS51649.1 hypothetical protein EF912_20550 [Streptomyces sp. WAC07061]
MAEQQMYAFLHCEPCEECVREEWQSIQDGRLRWEAYDYCPRYAVQACDRGWGVPPPEVRERIVAREGTVHLPVGGPDGVSMALLREVYGLTIAEVMNARATGWRVTPVEARYLAASARDLEVRQCLPTRPGRVGSVGFAESRTTGRRGGRAG